MDKFICERCRKPTIGRDFHPYVEPVAGWLSEGVLVRPDCCGTCCREIDRMRNGQIGEWLSFLLRRGQAKGRRGRLRPSV